MYRMFVIEDDAVISESIARLGKMWNLTVKCQTDFLNIMSDFASFDPHIVLIDISLPFFNGYHWCEEIRRVSKVPVIFISSAADNMNIVMAMSLGADDFIAKPFDGEVLMAKVQAMLRRTYDFSSSIPILEHRGALLNTSDGSLVYNGEKIDLTKNEYRILLSLMRCKGKTVSREKLMEQLWESESFIDENTLTVNVGRLRRKLDSVGLKEFITTKFGVGYIIE
ncbi:MAG: response regulator transcription factor [Clostridiales bacterium]|nr:response regulator transcription factor [Clostridiales bacterium]